VHCQGSGRNVLIFGPLAARVLDNGDGRLACPKNVSGYFSLWWREGHVVGGCFSAQKAESEYVGRSARASRERDIA
jgi:hypothetical protein